MDRRVLVVDDDEAVRGALVCALGIFGCEVYAAQSAEEGRAVLVGWPPDALLLDLCGAGDTAALARAASSAGVPVVLCSASGDRYLAAAAPRLGARAILAKPFDLDDLGALVATLPRGAGAGRAAAVAVGAA